MTFETDPEMIEFVRPGRAAREPSREFEPSAQANRNRVAQADRLAELEQLWDAIYPSIVKVRRRRRYGIFPMIAFAPKIRPRI